MRILWLARWDPRNPTDGAQLYSKGLLDGLAATGAEIEVLAYAGKDPALAAGPSSWKFSAVPPPRKWRPLSLLTTLQSDAFRHRSRAMAEAIESRVRAGVDAVAFDYFATGWAVPIVETAQRQTGRLRPVIAYVSHNHEATLRRKVAREFSGSVPLRQILRLDAAKAARMERKLVEAADIVTSNTDVDRAAFTRQAPDKIHLTLVPAYSGPMDLGPDIGADRPRRVTMMGSLEWIAKQENLRRFIAAAEAPFAAADIELVVIGKSDAEFRRSIEASSRICRCMGFVDDPKPWLSSSRIGLMPDEIGGGFKHRYLNYIFGGLPVATIRSEAVGLPLDPDEAMIVGDTADQLVAEMVRSIDDLAALNRKRRLAFERCRHDFDWNVRGIALREAIASAIAGR